MTYESLWTVCLERYFEEFAPNEDMPAENKHHVDAVFKWIKTWAKVHKTFSVWTQFLLHDYAVCMTFRLALHTGNFRLILALRRIAHTFHSTGKYRYQVLIADHLAKIARMPTSDMKLMAELFSVALGKDASARHGLDERQ